MGRLRHLLRASDAGRRRSRRHRREPFLRRQLSASKVIAYQLTAPLAGVAVRLPRRNEGEISGQAASLRDVRAQPLEDGCILTIGLWDLVARMGR